jgi:REP element-mobilizing transposase RayT
MTTNSYIKMVYDNKAEPFNKKLWQQNFYEHIIRNEKSYLEIYEYIEKNVLKWEEDKFYYTQL